MQAIGRCGRAAADRELPIVAVSCHSRAEVVRAESAGADFAVFAPMFEKKDAPGTAPVGLGALHEACAVKMPVLALGGITLRNARSCIEAGAAGIAAIRLFQENRISEVVRALGQSSFGQSAHE
jgi:thiamine-phosphate pyrophosphorylase